MWKVRFPDRRYTESEVKEAVKLTPGSGQDGVTTYEMWEVQVWEAGRLRLDAY